MHTLRRTLLGCLTLFGIVMVARTGVAAAQEAIVFTPPTSDTVAGNDLGLLMHARAERLLIEGKAPAVVNERQVLRMGEALEIEPSSWWSGGAIAIARQLGASRVVMGRLRSSAVGYSLELATAENGTDAKTVVLPSALGAAVETGARAIAKLAWPAVKLPPEKVGTLPDAAVLHYAACHAALLQQPILLESPSLLHGQELSHAVSECGAAISLAPNYDEARSALGLTLAISDRSKEAVDAIARLPTASYDPQLFLTHYWLATRYRSHQDGLAILREEVRRHPASLLARGFLAEHLFVTRQYEDSVAEWKRISDLAPKAALPYARISAALARLKRHDEAIAVAQKIITLTPNNPNHVLALGARYVDAGRYDEAIATLTPITGKNARPEALERLGWAWLGKGMIGKARDDFQQAFDSSGHTPAGWRTRGRALGGLIRAATQAKDDQTAQDLIARAEEEDFAPFLMALHDPALTAAITQAEQKKTHENVAKLTPRGPHLIRPVEATPFQLDPAGEFDANARAFPAVPNFLEVLRF